MSNRTRGTMVRPIPTKKLAEAIAEYNGWDVAEIKPDTIWLIDRGEGEGPRYAIIDTEGVYHAPEIGPFYALSQWRDAQYPVPVQDVVSIAGEPTDDLADVVRTFGDRLEANYSMARRWARREA